jgi:hypothetical protein
LGCRTYWLPARGSALVEVERLARGLGSHHYVVGDRFDHGGGSNVSNVPGFTSKATCEAAASVVKQGREKCVHTACVQQ